MKTKLTHLHQKITRIAGTNWGLNKDLRRRLYETVAERMILHGAAAWAYPLSARQSRLLNSIQRKFLLNNTGAYSTTPTAELQVIEGIIPLHIKAEQEAVYVRTAKLRKTSNYNNINPINYEDGTTSTKFHPAILQLEDRISLKKQFLPVPGLNIYTDGSRMEDKTSSTFCAQRNTNGWPNFVPSTQSSRQSFLLYRRLVFGQARPTNKIRKKTEFSQSHLNSILEFNLLGKVDIRQQLDSAFRSNVKRHNEKVTRNCYVLPKIIDCILFCCAFELALRGHDEREDSLNTGVFRGLVNFSAEFDSSLKDHLTNAIVFKGKSKEIQNDLLGCMLTVCRNHMKNEISKASFVSVIADGTTDVSSISQLVVVFRYVLSNGQPVERFWEFTNPSGHDAKSIAECIQASLEKVVAKPEKLISQSYDGTNVMSGQHAGVQAFIQRAYKNAQYVHCYAHQLNLIVGQATSPNQQVRVFFSN
ncbi:hypothetical protein AVEN_189452-1 [Araneus ventricosus]|uniref:DUF4371 domain-containing protein n=1 Tax=Araneus ventricosus TaxID=182803 RepID=A0A4Y2RDL1_ARAVE|nr:hypothetical protein AVEN_189452-1 [Araneus ventricosus]